MTAWELEKNGVREVWTRKIGDCIVLCTTFDSKMGLCRPEILKCDSRGDIISTRRLCEDFEGTAEDGKKICEEKISIELDKMSRDLGKNCDDSDMLNFLDDGMWGTAVSPLHGCDMSGNQWISRGGNGRKLFKRLRDAIKWAMGEYPNGDEPKIESKALYGGWKRDENGRIVYTRT